MMIYLKTSIFRSILIRRATLSREFCSYIHAYFDINKTILAHTVGLVTMIDVYLRALYVFCRDTPIADGTYIRSKNMRIMSKVTCLR